MKSDEFFRRQLYQLRDELKENEIPSSQRDLQVNRRSWAIWILWFISIKILSLSVNFPGGIHRLSHFIFDPDFVHIDNMFPHVSGGMQWFEGSSKAFQKSSGKLAGSGEVGMQSRRFHTICCSGKGDLCHVEKWWDSLSFGTHQRSSFRRAIFLQRTDPAIKAFRMILFFLSFSGT